MNIAVVLIASQTREEHIADRLRSAVTEISDSAETSLWYIDDSDGDLPEKSSYGYSVHVKNTGQAFYSAESILPVLEFLYGEYPQDLLIFPDDYAGKELAARLAFRLGIRCAGGILNASAKKDIIEFKRLAYNGNLEAIFEMSPPLTATMDPFSFDPAPVEAETEAVRHTIPAQDLPAIFSEVCTVSAENESDLKSADIALVIGRGLQTRENARDAATLADAMGAVLAGTRPAAIAEWTPPSGLIGISGTFINPKLCLAIGASGARAFAVGVKNSDFLISVNIDEKAAIFSICDAGVICDGHAFIKALTKLLDKDRQNES